MTSGGFNMATKSFFGILLRPAPTVLRSAPEAEAPPAEGDQLARELAGREIDARVREALQRGETSGDVVVLDDQGNEIVGALSSKTIFDL